MSEDVPKFPSDEAERFQVRMPPGLRERIKEAAAKNNRSMNAEIISTLEMAYPPKSIDVELLSEFLSSLAGMSSRDADPKYLADLNNTLATVGHGWTVKSGWDGVVTFFPYPTRTDPSPKEG